MEIKRLNASMATIRSQLNKYEEQVEECKRYQKFLDSVTPVEWQEQQKQARLARQQQRHAAWLLDCEALKKQKQDAKGEVSFRVLAAWQLQSRQAPQSKKYRASAANKTRAAEQQQSIQDLFKSRDVDCI